MLYFQENSLEKITEKRSQPRNGFCDRRPWNGIGERRPEPRNAVVEIKLYERKMVMEMLKKDHLCKNVVWIVVE